MTRLTRQFFAFGYAVLLGTALSACGGGSDNDSADNNSSAAGTITKECARSGSSVSVTQEGCLANIGNNTQSLVCSTSRTVHMLTGTGLTRDQVIQGGSSVTSGGGISINGVSLRCS